MRPGTRNIGLSLGALALVAVAYIAPGGYTPTQYVNGNYVQGGGYTGAGSGSVAIDAPLDASSATMSVAIADSADPVITGGDAYSYSVTLTVSGATASTVSVATTLDSSLTYSSSSGTGWTCGASGQVVTCTAASISVGTAPAITINVTTGGSAVAASSSVVASAANASNATGSQGTTVNLVTKDATMGVYLPASTTEAQNFITRKGLSIAVPVSIWNMQEASGNLADSGSGGITLTATAGGLTYNATDASLSRKVITFTDGGLGSFKSTSASLPDISTTDCTTMALLKLSAPAAVRKFLGHGTTVSQAGITTTSKGRATSGANTADTTGNITGAWKPITIQTNHGTSTVMYTDAEKITPTFGSPTGKTVFLGANGAASPPMSAAYLVQWPATVSAADLKAYLQALGFTITWT